MPVFVRKLGVCVALGVLVLSAPALGVIIDTQQFDGRTYHLLAPSTWEEARAEADAIEFGHLVTIESQAEQDWVWSTLGVTGDPDVKRSLWIGLLTDTPEPEEAPFEWVTGDPLSYTNWGPGAPSRYRRDKFYGEMNAWQNGLWNHVDGSDTRWHYGVVEVGDPVHAPAPGASVLALIGIGVAVRMRRRLVATA